jgi:hypothetical protein
MKRVLIIALVLSVSMAAGIALAQQQAPAPAPAAAPAPAPAPKAAAPAPAAPAAALTIARMEIAAGVENREPVGVAATFPATQEKVYCFLEFTNVPAETGVSIVWSVGGKEMGTVPLTIKAFSKFRTWAYKTVAGMKGEWKVDVKDASGAVLKSAAFTIQ